MQTAQAADRKSSSSDTQFVDSSVMKPVATPLQFETTLAAAPILSSRAGRGPEERDLLKVNGADGTIAILDTGLRPTHLDFADRIAAQRNFTADNGADPGDASDGNGHGTNIAGVIAAGGVHMGVAPAARIVALKVRRNDGGGNFASVADALQWVLDHHGEFSISAICLAGDDGGNYRSDASLANDRVASLIRSLAASAIVCCVPAGEDYYTHGSVQGMAYPAILRDTICVGAVFDGDIGPITHPSGAEAYETGADRIAPYSQRLHEKVGRECAIDLFAPAAPIISSGILTDTGSSIQHGSGVATAAVAGLVLLLQSLHRQATGGLPSIGALRRWLVAGAATFVDCDEEHDNVLHTALAFRRLDPFGALQACARELAGNALSAAAGRPARNAQGSQAQGRTASSAVPTSNLEWKGV